MDVYTFAKTACRLLALYFFVQLALSLPGMIAASLLPLSFVGTGLDGTVLAALALLGTNIIIYLVAISLLWRKADFLAARVVSKPPSAP